MRTLVKPEDAGLLALITSVRTGVAPEQAVEVMSEEAVPGEQHTGINGSAVIKPHPEFGYNVALINKDGQPAHDKDAGYHAPDITDARDYAKSKVHDEETDPNDHDINAVSALHASKTYHAAAHMLDNHGSSGELHNTIVQGLRKLANQHAEDYHAHSALGTQTSHGHHDIAHGMTHDAINDVLRAHNR